MGGNEDAETEDSDGDLTFSGRSTMTSCSRSWPSGSLMAESFA